MSEPNPTIPALTAEDVAARALVVRVTGDPDTVHEALCEAIAAAIKSAVSEAYERAAKIADEWADAGDTSILVPSAAKAMLAVSAAAVTIAKTIRARKDSAP